MGQLSVTSSSSFRQEAEVIYDFVSDPRNWATTYEGSAGTASDLALPLKPGDTWTETVKLSSNTYSAKWTLITAIRGQKFAFQQVNGIGAKPDGTGGNDGICTISYTFEPAGEEGLTLFTRNLTCELPRFERMPDDLLVACARPDGIDLYLKAISEKLDGRKAD